MRPGSIGIGAALLLVASIGAGAFASQAQEGNAATPAPAIDVSACQSCHGRDGVSRNPRVPNLAGQQPDYLAAQLRAFKAGTRTNPLMQSVAGQLSDEQINALAQYWHGQPAAGAGAGAHGATAGGAAAIPPAMSFPADFPAGFTLYQTHAEGNVVTERYANGVAIAAARAGRPLPDGSTIIAVNRNGAGGPVASYAGMESRAGRGAAIPALLRNGDWTYAVFDARRVRNDRLNQATCLACHRPQEPNSFVFTLPALRERARAP